MGQQRGPHDTVPSGGLQPRSIDNPEQGDQHDGTDGGRDQAAQASNGRQAKQAEEKPADKRADHTHDQVTNESEVATLHDLPGEPACSDANQKKPEHVHGELTKGWGEREGRIGVRMSYGIPRPVRGPSCAGQGVPGRAWQSGQPGFCAFGISGVL